MHIKILIVYRIFSDVAIKVLGKWDIFQFVYLFQLLWDGANYIKKIEK